MISGNFTYENCFLFHVILFFLGQLNESRYDKEISLKGEDIKTDSDVQGIFLLFLFNFLLFSPCMAQHFMYVPNIMLSSMFIFVYEITIINCA